MKPDDLLNAPLLEDIRKYEAKVLVFEPETLEAREELQRLMNSITDSHCQCATSHVSGNKEPLARFLVPVIREVPGSKGWTCDPLRKWAFVPAGWPRLF